MTPAQTITAIRDRLRSPADTGLRDDITALCGPTQVDRRSIPWAIRIRLYKAGDAEPEGDTEAGSAPDAPGTWEVLGFPAIAAALADTAASFHASPVYGLDAVTIAKALDTLRSTLSRRGGEAVTLRAQYTTAGEAWTARVDIQRGTPQ